jgi:tryptophanyl-tRNA synthetase
MTEVPRLMSLDDPTKKMSKSRPAGCLFVDDSPNEIRAKIKTAVTDSGREISYDPKKKPAVSNLLLIYSALGGQSPKLIERKFAGKGYAEFKADLAETIVEVLNNFQKRKRALAKDRKGTEKIIEAGNRKAAKVANKKIVEVREKVGIILK